MVSFKHWMFSALAWLHWLKQAPQLAGSFSSEGSTSLASPLQLLSTPRLPQVSALGTQAPPPPVPVALPPAPPVWPELPPPWSPPWPEAPPAEPPVPVPVPASEIGTTVSPVKTKGGRSRQLVETAAKITMANQARKQDRK